MSESEFRVNLHLCTEGPGGCFTDSQTLGTRPDPETLKALLGEAHETFLLLYGEAPDHQTIELSKVGDEDGVLDPAAAEKK